MVRAVKGSTMGLKAFALGNETFQRVFFKKHEAELLELAHKGQHPKALFIGCSDSRVIPDLIVQAKPGELFVVRNVGNFVPPYDSDGDYHGTASAIEYAVEVLEVGEVIICGHSHCGACESLYRKPEDFSHLVHIKKWLDLGERAKKMALAAVGENAERRALLRTTERFSIIAQLENLLTYPFVQKRMRSDKLFVHGWYYDIETGLIDYFDPESYRFLPLSGLSKEVVF